MKHFVETFSHPAVSHLAGFAEQHRCRGGVALCTLLRVQFNIVTVDAGRMDDIGGSAHLRLSKATAPPNCATCPSTSIQSNLPTIASHLSIDHEGTLISVEILIEE